MENKPDFDEVENDIKDKVKAHFVGRIEEVLNIILSDKKVLQNETNPIYQINMVNSFL